MKSRIRVGKSWTWRSATIGSAILLAPMVSGFLFSPATTSKVHPWTINRRYAGQTINVLVPPWADMPTATLGKFTSLTGVKVNLEVLSWDDIHDKIVTAEGAGTAPADVTEFDWSWVGQFSQAGWYTPLNNLISPKVQSDSIPIKTFTINHKVLAIPYDLGYRATLLNWTDFKKAGITTTPTTWSQLIADAKILKNKHVVQYPVAQPLSVIENTSTAFYQIVKSEGANFFTKTWQPLFTKAGSPIEKALIFEKTLYQDKLVSPGEIAATDVSDTAEFQNGSAAILLSDDPLAGVSTYTNPAVSKVAKDQLRLIPFPGNDGVRTGTFALTEGLGIPKQSTHKGAAAMFINWWMQTPQLLVMYNTPQDGDYPSETYARNVLIAQHKIFDANVIRQIDPTVKPLFPQGTPSWYQQFSTAVSTMVQSVVEGKQQPLPALRSLASQVVSMRQVP